MTSKVMASFDPTNDLQVLASPVQSSAGESVIVLSLTAEEAMELFSRALQSDADDTEASVSAMRKLASVVGRTFAR